MTPWILLLVGLLLVFIEFYLPGGIMGAAGAIILLASIILFFTQTDSILAAILFLVLVIVLISLLIKFALWRIQHAKSGSSIYSSGDQSGYVASQFDENAVGKEGEAITDLHPGGHVKVNEKKYHALSQSGYIEKGMPIIVIGGEGESLMVKQKKKEKQT